MNPVTIGDSIELYQADCRKLLPTLYRQHKKAVIVSDPPYGINQKYRGKYRDRGGADYRVLVRHLKPFARCLLQYPEETMALLVPEFGPPDEVFTWCYNSMMERQSRIFSFWGVDVDFSRVRVPAKNKRVSGDVRAYDWTTDFQQVKNVSKEKTAHPCQIPVKLMVRVPQFIRAEVVIDPFLGSGSTGVAAAQLGMKFIGIEIVPEYFEIAVKRIGDAQKES